jgi:hypothetical protein
MGLSGAESQSVSSLAEASQELPVTGLPLENLADLGSPIQRRICLDLTVFDTRVHIMKLRGGQTQSNFVYLKQRERGMQPASFRLIGRNISVRSEIFGECEKNPPRMQCGWPLGAGG